MRLPPIKYDDLDSEQKRLHDVVTKTRSSGLGGPMSVLVRAPHVGEPADAMHNAFRLHTKLDRKVLELLILIVARRHGSEFAWEVHERLALKAGLEQHAIDAIRERRTPRFNDEKLETLYDIVRELLDTSGLCDTSYRRGLDAFGLDLMIEIVSATGFYSMVSLVLNTFDVKAPSGERVLAYGVRME